MSAREAELAANLDRVRARVADAERAAGREPGSVSLVVVTKFFPASDVRLLAGLGVTDVGENRHPEARDKKADCEDLGLRWHYIGGLQSNKAGQVAAYADVVESVDRAKLLARLDRAAGERGVALEVLLQVGLDSGRTDGAEVGADRAGVEPEDLPALADAVTACEHLVLAGLMAVAPLGEDPATAFDRLAGIRAGFLADHPGATTCSAGMSGDLEQAVAAGATHVRVGSAILGSRPSTH
ncbi:YggS family pyridoxal phosphate-dependent enzyme [Nocardioides bruguierae]|uniref:Pyridoxal phosphate homeostasis protein n=1 Tax=Nocardioides bruguierae TaxID=2945102 RepID=A0A9X2D946_9ACTN|nr:YggS family pyridoxal phosphate-dependent enzyme [Nocardioides bruguierae]MCM0621611.1 YggS family pyridoxal phosphate-dependent enzyme [Nocardioides bruguierae]